LGVSHDEDVKDNSTKVTISSYLAMYNKHTNYKYM